MNVSAGLYGYGYFYIANWCTDTYTSSWFDLSAANFDSYWCECPNSDGQCGYWQCRWETVAVPVAIDLTWTPNGDASRGINNWSSRGINYNYHSRGVGSTAGCNLSGSFVVDGTDLLAGAAYSWGNSSTSTSGWMNLSRFDR